MKLLLLPLTLLLGYSAGKAPAIELKGYVACKQAMLMPASNAAFICYASTQRGCRQGTVILAYEKVISKPTEKTRFAIADTVKLNVSYPKSEVEITNCVDAAGKSKQYFVLFKADGSGKKYLSDVRRVWGVNAQGNLVPVPVKVLKCLNQDTAD